jgi:hypothetical protein
MFARLKDWRRISMRRHRFYGLYSQCVLILVYAGRISFSTAVNRRLRLPASAVASSSAP